MVMNAQSSDEHLFPSFRRLFRRPLKHTMGYCGGSHPCSVSSGGCIPSCASKGVGTLIERSQPPTPSVVAVVSFKSQNRESASHRYAPFESVVAWMTSGTPRGHHRHQRWRLAVHRSVHACRTLRPSHTQGCSAVLSGTLSPRRSPARRSSRPRARPAR